MVCESTASPRQGDERETPLYLKGDVGWHGQTCFFFGKYLHPLHRSTEHSRRSPLHAKEEQENIIYYFYLPFHPLLAKEGKEGRLFLVAAMLREVITVNASPLCKC
ncbi:MAG: hypothetical protein E3K36_10240 [Candidatus Brocadia sp.]|nr:hypothetical protein [Candidatus Brocadia sp.]